VCGKGLSWLVVEVEGRVSECPDQARRRDSTTTATGRPPAPQPPRARRHPRRGLLHRHLLPLAGRRLSRRRHHGAGRVALLSGGGGVRAAVSLVSLIELLLWRRCLLEISLLSCQRGHFHFAFPTRTISTNQPPPTSPPPQGASPSPTAAPSSLYAAWPRAPATRTRRGTWSRSSS
jgi:hypothetical protein